MRSKSVRGFYLEKKQSHGRLKDNTMLFLKLRNTPEEQKPVVVAEIFENNIPAVHYFLRKRFGTGMGRFCSQYRMTPDELFSLCCEFLLEAIYRFDVDRGFQFSTLLSKMIFNGIGKYFDRMKSLSPKDVSIDKKLYLEDDHRGINLVDAISVDNGFEEALVDNALLQSIIDELGKVMSPRDMGILKLYTVDGLTQMEIAKIYGISQVQVSRIMGKIRKVAQEIASEGSDMVV